MTALGRSAAATLPLLAALIALAVWNPSGRYWSGVESPKAQCEAYDPHRLRAFSEPTDQIYDPRKLDRVIREPQNTVSNIAYIVAGLAILFAARRPISRSVGLGAIFLGLGSGVYHASLLPEWRLVDILGMYAVLYGLVLLAIVVNLRPAASRGVLALAAPALLWAVAVYTGVHRNEIRWLGVKWFDSTYVFVAAAALAGGLLLLAVVRAGGRGARAATISASAAAISFAGGLGDRFGSYWADPEALIQGHAVWHIFGAAALLAAYEAAAATGFDGSTVARLGQAAPASAGCRQGGGPVPG